MARDLCGEEDFLEHNIYTEEERHWSRGGNTGVFPANITPSQVNVLVDGEIFVSEAISKEPIWEEPPE